MTPVTILEMAALRMIDGAEYCQGQWEGLSLPGGACHLDVRSHTAYL